MDTRPNKQQQTWLAEIREHLQAIAKLCPKHRAWSKLNPSLSAASLAAFEAEHGIKLPSGYRHYLTELGDGGAGLPWHHDCTCGQIPQLARMNTAEAAKEFPMASLDLDEWFDPNTELGQEAPYILSEGVSNNDGTMFIGHSLDHCNYYLVVEGERAGEVWLDCTGYDGPFVMIAGDFLELSSRLLGEFVAELREEEASAAK